jgi:hypothetical protein
VQGQPEYELAANGNDKFTIQTLSGYTVQFQPDSNGKMTTAFFIQPNGTFKATRK